MHKFLLNHIQDLRKENVDRKETVWKMSNEYLPEVADN